MEFKVGDKVMCIEAGSGGLTAGKIYTVIRTTHRRDETFVVVEGLDDMYHASRFSLVASSSNIKEILLYLGILRDTTNDRKVWEGVKKVIADLVREEV